ncbi:MAG TPA: MlaD family protein [Gemmatimonadaceae bacterium]|nr:MlaD family protein [Gemmatimonadaceae bacterium]
MPGLVLVGALIAGVLWVLLSVRIGALRGDTFRLHAVTAEARGVLKGTEVWLGGQAVGRIAEIRFRPITADTLGRLLLELEILEEYQPHIRRDSRAQIRSGGTLVGQPVLSISIGTANAPALASGDTIETLPQADAEGLTARVAAASRVFPDIARNTQLIREQMRSAGGPMGELDARGMELEVLRGRAERLGRTASGGEGTIGLALRRGDADIGVRVEQALARVDSLRALLESERTSVGRFRRDTTLATHVESLREEIAAVRALFNEPAGTAGRLAADGAIALELRQLENELSAVIDDIRRRPLRYVPF